MAEPPEPDMKPISLNDPAMIEVIRSFPKEVQEWFSRINWDIRIDLTSFTRDPYEVTVMDQVALAGMEPEQAAEAIVKITSKAAHGSFEHVERDGQEELIRWVLKSYFQESPIPIELMAAIGARLKPEKEKKSG